MNPRKRPTPQAGFTLIEVSISIIIVAIVLSAFTVVLIQNVKLQLHVYQMKASMEIESHLESWITNKVATFFETGGVCSDLESSLRNEFVTGTQAPKGFNIWTWVDPTSVSGHVKLDLSDSSSVGRRTAVDRCKTLQTPTTSPNADLREDAYFCLRYLNDRELGGLGFFRYPTFAEIKVMFRDLQDGSKLTCQRYTQKLDPMRGLMIHYKIFSQCDTAFVSEGCLGGALVKESTYGRSIFSGVIYVAP